MTAASCLLPGFAQAVGMLELFLALPFRKSAIGAPFLEGGGGPLVGFQSASVDCQLQMAEAEDIDRSTLSAFEGGNYVNSGSYGVFQVLFFHALQEAIASH